MTFIPRTNDVTNRVIGLCIKVSYGATSAWCIEHRMRMEPHLQTCPEWRRVRDLLWDWRETIVEVHGQRNLQQWHESLMRSGRWEVAALQGFRPFVTVQEDNDDNEE